MSDSTNSATIKVGVDATGVEVGMRKIDDAASKTARNLENLGKGDGFNRLGDGAEASAAKIDRTTKGFADSIMRATAAMQSGAKGSAEYYAALANSRGVNVAALKPYLDQLDQVTRQTKLAAEAQKKLADGENFIASLKGKADAVGKTASQLLELRAAELGVADAAKPMIDRLRESEEAAGGFGGALGDAKGILLSLGAALSVGALTSWVKGAIDAADGLKDLSKSTAVSVENLAGLRLASKQTGAELEGTAAAINKLSVNMGKDSEKFAKLGIVAKEPLEAFKQLADVFNAIEDPQQRAAFGAAALGKSWAEAAPLLSEGSVKIGEMIERGTSLSGITSQLADDADEFNDVLAELMTSADAISTKLAISLLPILKAMSEDMAGASNQANSLSGIFVTGLAEAFRAIVILGGNVAFVFKTIGNDIGGIAAQLGMLATLDFEGFTRANELIKQDAIAGRKAFDEWEKKILEAGKNVQKASVDAGKAASDALTGGTVASSAAIAKFNGAVDESAKRAGEAAKKRAAALEKEKQAYVDLTSAIGERVAATAREANGLAPLTESQKLQIRLDQDLLSGKISINAEQYKADKQRIQSIAIDESVIEGRKIMVAAELAYQKLQKEAADLSSKKIADITREADANEALAKTFGMSRAQIEALTVARLEDQLAQRGSNKLTLEQIAALEKEIEQRKRNAAALGSIDTQEAAKKANDAMLSDWTKTIEKYEDVFRTGFADMLNNGKDGWKSFTKSLVTTFKTSVADQLYKMFLQPFVMQIVGNFAGSTGSVGGGGGAGGNAMQLIETGKSIYSAFASAASSGGGLAGFGKSLYASFTGAAGSTGAGATASAGSMTASLPSGVVGALSIAGWVAAGAALSNALYKRGWDASNGSISNTGSVIAAPTLALDKINRALGMSNTLANALSGAATISRVFGRKNPEVENFGIEGTFGAAGFDGNAYQNILQKGGIFRSDKRYQTDTALDAGTESTFDDTIKNLMLAVKGFGAQMGIEATQIESYTKAISLTLTADDAKNQELIAGVFGGIGDDLAKLLIPKIAELSEKGETAAAALQRVATGYGLIDAALESIGRSFGAVGIDSLDARERLIELSGGLETFGKGAAYFAQNYLSEAERLAPITASVNKALSDLGLSGVTTRDQFKDVVLGLDLTTESGATTYSGLMKIQEAFALLHPVIDTTTEAITAAAAAMSAERTSLLEQINALTQSPATLAGQARNAINPENLALYDQVQELSATKIAVEAVNAANKTYIDQIREIERSYLTQAELRALDIVGMDASTVAWYDLLQARKAEQVANLEAKDAALAAAQAIKDTSAALLGAGVAEIDKRFGGGAAKATESIADTIAAERARLEARLFDLAGTASERLARSRQAELDATNDLLDPILRLIFAQEDLASAAEAAARATEALKASASTAFDVLGNSVNAEKLSAKAGFDGRVAILNAQKSAAAAEFSAKGAFAQAVAAAQEKSNQAISQFAGSLRSTLDGLRLDQNSVGDRIGAQKQIADALEAAKRGKLPTDGSLSGALSIASQKDTSSFASYADFARDFGVTAGKIADLSGIADTSLSASDQALAYARASAEGIAQQAQISAEGFDEQIKKAQDEYDRQISNFDATIQVARDQLDAALGTKLEVMSLKDALLNFARSVDALKPATPAAVVAPLPQAYLASQAPPAGNAELASALLAMSIELAAIKASTAQSAASGATTAGVLASNRPLLVEVSA